jgi:hypothetical protein
MPPLTRVQQSATIGHMDSRFRANEETTQMPKKRSLTRLVLTGALLLPLLGTVPAVAEPQLIDYSRFEAVGQVEFIDSAAGQLRVHGQAFRLAPGLVIHGHAGSGRLQPGQAIGYRVDTRSGGTAPLITDIWVLDE